MSQIASAHPAAKWMYHLPSILWSSSAQMWWLIGPLACLLQITFASAFRSPSSGAPQLDPVVFGNCRDEVVLAVVKMDPRIGPLLNQRIRER
jgi:hypothetical protein